MYSGSIFGIVYGDYLPGQYLDEWMQLYASIGRDLLAHSRVAVMGAAPLLAYQAEELPGRKLRLWRLSGSRIL